MTGFLILLCIVLVFAAAYLWHRLEDANALLEAYERESTDGWLRLHALRDVPFSLHYRRPDYGPTSDRPKWSASSSVDVHGFALTVASLELPTPAMALEMLETDVRRVKREQGVS